MNEFVIVDTSAWICSFSEKGFQEIKDKLIRYLDEDRVAITGLIILELLQGTNSKKEFDKLFERLQGLHYLLTEETSWLKTSSLSFSLQRDGFKIPSTDLLIAAIAIENNCLLLHKDKHFDYISQHSKLKSI